MPQKNSIKVYVEESFYHIYNRGVEKRTIFEELQDYKVFLKYLKESLSPPPKPENIRRTFTLQGASFKGIPRQPKNYFKEIELHSYCLMPNHFHLLVKQKSKNSIEKIMRSLATRYSMYFNKKYDRVGKLFQGHYKAVLIKDDDYLLHLSRYIHLNPLKYTDSLAKGFSSYADYLQLRKTKWIKTDFILGYFNTSVIKELKKFNKYQEFVENYTQDSKLLLGNLSLEEE